MINYKKVSIKLLKICTLYLFLMPLYYLVSAIEWILNEISDSKWLESLSSWATDGDS